MGGDAGLARLQLEAAICLLSLDENFLLTSDENNCILPSFTLDTRLLKVYFDIFISHNSENLYLKLLIMAIDTQEI